MKIKSINKFLLCAVVAVSAASASAWDDTGHKVTAYIAWQQMTPETREKAFGLLIKAPEDSDLSVYYNAYESRSAAVKKLELFMIAATWADIVRNRDFKDRFEKYNHSNWHYADVFWKQNGSQAEVLDDFGEESGKAVQKLYEFKDTLENSASEDAYKALALAWFLHVGGDIHNPLHNASRVTDLELKGDLGGNLFLLTRADAPPAERRNLHSFWDSVISRNMPRKNDACDSDYVAKTAVKIMRKFPYRKMATRIKTGDFESWHKEGFDLLPGAVYAAGMKRNEMPSKGYQKDSFNIGREQIALAGYRLGETLNMMLGSR